jgi:hypothetical protein
MRIAQADIKMTGNHTLNQEKIHEEKLDFWIGNRNRDNQESGSQIQEDKLTLSAVGRSLAEKTMENKAVSSADSETATNENPQMRTMRLILEKLTGKKIRVADFSRATSDSTAGTAGEQAGWGMSYDYFESYREQEETTFQAAGLIQTSDGREINFQLDIAMSREFYQETAIHIRAGDAKSVDPLVINFAGSAAELTDMTFSFDLDGNGTEEEIAMLGRGSGYLALDLNEDGRINSGRELFGPQKGNGFAELAAYDDDNNGWLDENDPIFTKLQVWIKDAAQGDYLADLRELNIGALYLGRTETPFQLNNAANEELGRISESGIFVRENGSVGSIQEIFVTG